MEDDNENSKRTIKNIAVGSLTATAIASLLHPIDVVKVRKQFQGELQHPGTYKIFYKGTLGSALKIIRYDGFSGLFRGVGAGIMYQMANQCIRLGLFQATQNMGLNLDEDKEPSLKRTLASAALCGVVSAFITSPLYMAKCMLMIRSESRIAVGYQRPYENSIQALRDIYHRHGLRRGLWRGTTSGILRVSLGSAVQLGSFMQIKEYLNVSVERHVQFACINTLLAAFASSLITAPVLTVLDVIRCRVYIQPRDVTGHGEYYDGMWHCIKLIKQTEGYRGFLKGSIPSLIYCLVVSFAALVSWEEINHIREQRRNSRDYHIDFGS